MVTRSLRQRNSNNSSSLKIAFFSQWPGPIAAKIAMLMDAMLRARDVVAARSWSTSQEPTSECWWADVLADLQGRQRRVSRGLGGKLVERAFYTLADDPHPMILSRVPNVPGKQHSAAPI
jgi:hypothetical protein